MSKTGDNLIADLLKIASEVSDYDKALRWINEEVHQHEQLDEVLRHLFYRGVVLSSETVGLVTNIFNNRE